MSKKPRPTVKLEHPTYGIKTEPLYQGYEERLVSWMEPDDVTSNEPKSSCQICGHPIDAYPNHLCKVCDKKFELDQESNIQRKRKRMVVKYQCQECLKAFSNVNMFQRHIKCHDEKKPYRCGQCSMRFYHSKNLAEHMEMHENEFNFSSVPTATEFVTSSNDDGLSYETYPTIKTEIEDTTECNNAPSDDPNRQPINCLQEFPTVDYEPTNIFHRPGDLTMVQMGNPIELFDQEREIETVDMAAFYDWSDSSTLSAASDTDRYESIVKIEAETIQLPATGYEAFRVEVPEEITESTAETDDVQRECYICKHCNKDFMYFGNYAKHLEQHTVGKLMCKFCHQMFGSAYQIRKHIRDYHWNQEMFDCSVCFATFPKHYFASHMRSHRSDDKTLVCRYCGCRFSEPSELFYHFKNSHSDSNQKPKQPALAAEDATGLEKYKCKYCGSRFDDVIQMYHHVKVHIKLPGAVKYLGDGSGGRR